MVAHHRLINQPQSNSEHLNREHSQHCSRQMQQFQRQLQERLQIVALSAIQPNTLLVKPPLGSNTTHWALSLNMSHSSQQLFLKSQPSLTEDWIKEYWVLDTAQAEVTVYRQPTAHGYQHQQVFHVGDRIRPLAFPELTLQVHEPLPLHFLTRTASGTKTYKSYRLPLKFID